MIDNNIGTPEKEEAAPEKVAALKQIREQFSGTAGRNQCQRLLAALARFPITTFEAMRFLDVYHCPARVLQLRKDGHQIVTHRRTVITEAGAKHSVGLYVLHRGAGAMREHLLERAQSLAMRLSHLGIGYDLAALSLADLWGALRYLQRMANA